MSIVDNDRDGLVMLLAHIVQLPTVAEASVLALPKQNPFENYKDLTLIWTSAKEYWINFGRSARQPVSQVLLMDDLKKRQIPGLVDTVPLLELEEVVRLLYSINKQDLSAPLAESILNRLKDDKILGRVRDVFLSGASQEDVIAAMKDATGKVGLSATGKPKITTNVLGDDYLSRLTTVVREPLGIPFIDTMLGGGLAAGEKIGFVIPTGCGKTTMGFQISDACVTADNVVGYVQTEQDLDGDLQQRICTLASGSSKNTWEEYAEALRDDPTASIEKYLKPQEWDRFQKMRQKWNDNFWFVDFTDPNKKLSSVDQIFDALEEQEQQHQRKIHTVVIDWWGRVADRIALAAGGDEATARRHRRGSMDVLKSRSSKMKIRLVVFQQCKGAQVSTKKAPSAHNAQEDSNFPDFFDYCFAMSKLSDKHEGVLTADKVRRGTKSTVRVVLDGAHGKLLPLDETRKSGMSTMKQEKAWL